MRRNQAWMSCAARAALTAGVAGVGERVAVGPCRLLQVERAAMPDAAAIGAGEAAAIEELRRQSRRVEAAERRLGMGGIGQAEGADTAVGPRLAPQPNQRVKTVLGLAAAILVGDRIAVFDEISRNLGPR